MTLDTLFYSDERHAFITGLGFLLNAIAVFLLAWKPTFDGEYNSARFVITISLINLATLCFLLG